ncbi:MAG: hypothetical protein ACR2NP_13450 [Pirellulaceae bacterium]
MPFSFLCESCNKKFTVSSKLIGKRIRCKGCQNVMRIPDPADFVSIQTEWIVECDDCGRQHRPDESLMGKRIRCKCGSVMHLQENSEAHLKLAPVEPLPQQGALPGSPTPQNQMPTASGPWQAPPPQISGAEGAQRQAEAERAVEEQRRREEEEKRYFES